MVKGCFPRNIILVLILSSFFCIFSHITTLAKDSVLIPEKVGNYTLKEKQVFPDSLNGVVYHFDNNGRTPIDLFVYPVLDEERQEDVSVVEKEV